MTSHDHRRRARGARLIAALAAAGLAVSAAACSLDSILGQPNVPNGYADPAITKTRDGALAAYYGALARFRSSFAGKLQGTYSASAFVLTSGLLSDELQPNFTSSTFGEYGFGTVLNHRDLPEVQDALSIPAFAEYPSTYADLQATRGQAYEALGLLRAYGGDLPPALAGHLHAVIGYSEIFLADFFCSGVPLSTVDFDGNYTLAAGSTTAGIYDDAIAHFDSAIDLAADSARIVNLALVGKARALLAEGKFAEAATVAATVPDGYRYALRFHDDGTPTGPDRSGFFLLSGQQWAVTVADREGIDGLDYVSSGDPRTASVGYARNSGGQLLFYPAKYAGSLSTSAAVALDDSAVVVASAVEARLIQAEAALQGNDAATWLSTLNTLRRTAINPALPDTTDPGTADARVDLMFRERAFWLFLTGHRQGDLRRLVRQYGRTAAAVYPRGTYYGGTSTYGGYVNAPIPPTERTSNPRSSGCFDRGA